MDMFLHHHCSILCSYDFYNLNLERFLQVICTTLNMYYKMFRNSSYPMTLTIYIFIYYLSFMKAKFMLLVLLVGFLLFVGCIEEPGPSNNGGANDNSNGGDNNDNTSDDDQTVTAGWYLKEIIDYDEKDENTVQYDVT